MCVSLLLNVDIVKCGVIVYRQGTSVFGCQGIVRHVFFVGCHLNAERKEGRDILVALLVKVHVCMCVRVYVLSSANQFYTIPTIN